MHNFKLTGIYYILLADTVENTSLFEIPLCLNSFYILFILTILVNTLNPNLILFLKENLTYRVITLHLLPLLY